MSCMISSLVVAALLVHSSLPCRKSADSMFMYVIVETMLLCPSMVFTWIMSLVLWYSVVAFQCLNVWKCICLSLGFWSFAAVLLRSFSKHVLMLCLGVWNTLSLILGRLFSMASSLMLAGNMRLLLPFSAVMYTALRSWSTCVHFKNSVSPILAPVSLSSCRSAAVFGLPALIRLSISCSVGMKGISFCSMYFGGVHVLPMNFK